MKSTLPANWATTVKKASREMCKCIVVNEYRTTQLCPQTPVEAGEGWDGSSINYCALHLAEVSSLGGQRHGHATHSLGGNEISSVRAHFLCGDAHQSAVRLGKSMRDWSLDVPSLEMILISLFKSHTGMGGSSRRSSSKSTRSSPVCALH